MKILILVLSYNNPPYDSLMRAQKETWDSVRPDGIYTLFYHGVKSPTNKKHSVALQNGHPSSMDFICDCTDAYYYMSEKLWLALEFMEKFDYDLIFRTNSSSYVHKLRLMEHAKSLPTEKLYSGWTFEDSNYDGGLCVSGAGIWLSRDCAEILLNKIDPNEEIEEDVYIGRLLRKEGIVALDDKSRIDYPQEYNRLKENPYHIRFKTTDRLQDARNMIELHKKLIG